MKGWMQAKNMVALSYYYYALSYEPLVLNLKDDVLEHEHPLSCHIKMYLKK